MKNKYLTYMICIMSIGASLGCSKDSSMVTVHGGVVTIINEDTKHTESVKEFVIDKYEVSRGDYKSFVNKTGRKKPKDWKVFGYDEKLSNHPVTYVTFNDAKAFCTWLDKDLPTEAQWQLAASGTENFTYPWGNDFKIGMSNTSTSKLRTTSPVTSYPEGTSPYGALNMAGNVWEWTTTEDGRNMIVKGGSWGLSHTIATTTNKALYPKEASTNNIGFRCVKN